MPKTQLPDYEPVHRGKSADAARFAIDENDWILPTKTEGTVDAADPFFGIAKAPQKTGPQAIAMAEPSVNPVDIAERLPTQRGHTITFSGILLFTFLVYFRPYELIPVLSWTAEMAFYVALLTIAVYVPANLSLTGGLTIRPREVNIMLLLLLACALSIPLATDRFLAWGSFTEFLKVVVIFVMIVNAVRTEGRFKVLILMVLAASCLVSVSALHDYVTGNLSLQGRRIEGIVGGLLSNPNDLALHLVTMVPIAIGLALSRRSFVVKALYLGCAILMMAGIVATFSRGGFLALMFVACYVFWNFARTNRVLVVSLALGVMLLSLAVVPSAYRSRISTTEDASANTRLDDLKRSVWLTIRHPLVGVGMGNYVIFSNSSKATHNSYTQVGAELGIAGMVLYILFLLHPLRRLRKIRKEYLTDQKSLRWISLGLEGSLIGYMVASFFASVAYTWYAFYLVAFAICVRRIILTRLEGQGALHAVDFSGARGIHTRRS